MSLIEHLVVKHSATGKVLVSYNYLSMIGWILLPVGLLSYGLLYMDSFQKWHVLLWYVSKIGIGFGGIMLTFWGSPRTIIGPYTD
jgi:hypothetical protein